MPIIICPSTKTLFASSKISDGVDTKDLNGCKLTCGDHGMLWPIPTGNVTMAKTLVKNLVTKLLCQLFCFKSTLVNIIFAMKCRFLSL